jgi:nicotinic acid mononucleotide adenylyltransferase
MFDNSLQQEISEIVASNKKFYITVAGGGNHFFPGFLNNFGTSKCFMGGNIVYSKERFNRFIGGVPEHYVSAWSARKLAVSSYKEAVLDSKDPDNSVGIGVTCSTTKLNERPGRKHHYYLAIHTKTETKVIYIDFTNEEWTRDEQDMCIGVHIVMAMYNYIKQTPGIKWLESCAGDILNIINEEDLWHNVPDTTEETLVVYSGSFNPLHDGHMGIINLAEKILGVRPVLEMSVHSVGKPELDYIDVSQRLQQQHEKDLYTIISDCPLYTDKISILNKYFDFQKLVFCIGYDTYERIFDVSHYKNEAAYESFIQQLQLSQTKFLLFGRGGKKDIKPEHQSFIIENDEALNYNLNISSTEIRKGLV